MSDNKSLEIGDQFRLSVNALKEMMKMGGISRLVEVVDINEQADGTKLLTLKSAVKN